MKCGLLNLSATPTNVFHLGRIALLVLAAVVAMESTVGGLALLAPFYLIMADVLKIFNLFKFFKEL